MATIEELQSLVTQKSLELRAVIEELVSATQRPFTPWAPHLSEDLLENCRVLPSRYHILDMMPKNSVCVEVGTQKGNFARSIVDKTNPSEFHIIDINLAQFDRSSFEAEISSGVIQLHEGNSVEIMESFSDEKFDWIYIDADHSYQGFVKDLEVSSRKVKPFGPILCNDYTVWSPGEVHPYGVLMGIHEFCAKHRWEFIYIGLQGQGYHDVCIRKHL